MKFFDDYRFTQQVRSQVRRHGFWAMRHRSPDWPRIKGDWAAGAGVTADSDRPVIMEGSPVPDWWAQNREIDDSVDPLERFLLDAIREERTVEFTFIGVEEATRRKVRPIRLVRVADFDRTYLEGYCETRQALRTFSLHRIVTPSRSRSQKFEL